MKKVFGNPIHFPRTNRGRPITKSEGWWIADLYNKKGDHFAMMTAHTGKREAMSGASRLLKSRHAGSVVASVTLSGPYKRKPTKTTKRK